MYECDCQTPVYRRIIEQLGAECLECKPRDAMVAADMDKPVVRRKTPRRKWARGLSDAKRARAGGGGSGSVRPVS